MQESKSTPTQEIKPISANVATPVLAEKMSNLAEKIKKQQNSPPLPKPPSGPEVEISGSKISVNQTENHVGSCQKIVIDVKTEPKTNNIVKIVSAPIEKDIENNKRNAKKSQEKKIKREISLVFEATPKKCTGSRMNSP